MIAHILIRVKNFKKAEEFYTKILGVLGLKMNIGEENIWCGFGEKDEPLFEISQADGENLAHTKMHIAFQAKSKIEVDQFYKLSLENGGVDNGKPGYREEYSPGYYSCFVKDLDENNIECVFFENQEKKHSKDFKKWFKIKPEVNEVNVATKEFSEAEIWWGFLGTNIGDEEDGKNELIERPILVLRKFSAHLFIGIPLSTKVKEGIFYVNFKDEPDLNLPLENQILEYAVLLSQIKVFSSKRLIRKIKSLSRGRLNEVKNKLKVLLKM